MSARTRDATWQFHVCRRDDAMRGRSVSPRILPAMTHLLRSESASLRFRRAPTRTRIALSFRLLEASGNDVDSFGVYRPSHRSISGSLLPSSASRSKSKTTASKGQSAAVASARATLPLPVGPLLIRLLFAAMHRRVSSSWAASFLAKPPQLAHHGFPRMLRYCCTGSRNKRMRCVKKALLAELWPNAHGDVAREAVEDVDSKEGVSLEMVFLTTRLARMPDHFARTSSAEIAVLSSALKSRRSSDQRDMRHEKSDRQPASRTSQSKSATAVHAPFKGHTRCMRRASVG